MYRYFKREMNYQDDSNKTLLYRYDPESGALTYLITKGERELNGGHDNWRKSSELVFDGENFNTSDSYYNVYGKNRHSMPIEIPETEALIMILKQD